MTTTCVRVCGKINCVHHAVAFCVCSYSIWVLLMLTNVAVYYIIAAETAPAWVNRDTCDNAWVRVRSPCSEHMGQTGPHVNCSGKHLKEINAAWFPCNVSRLSLDGNSLVILKNTSFLRLYQLLWLNLRGCKIKKIEPSTFDSLISLEYLDLEDNQLEFSKAYFPSHLFAPLTELKTLRLARQDSKPSLLFPKDLFSDLRSLLGISISNMGTGILQFGPQFCQLSNLSRLEITGSVTQITNSSFDNLACLTLMELSLYGLQHLKKFDVDSLRHFNNSLRSLHLERVYIGVQNALGILKPFRGRNMYEIYFNNIGLSSTHSDGAITTGDGIVDSDSVIYLKDICVERLTLQKSHIFVLKRSALPVGLLWRCLKHLDISFNDLQLSTGIYRILQMPRLETLVIVERHRENTLTDEDRKIIARQTPLVSFIPPDTRSQTNSRERVQLGPRRMSCRLKYPSDIRRRGRRQVTRTFYTSGSLRAIIVSLSCTRSNHFGGKYVYHVHCENMKTLVCRYCGLNDMTGEVTGLEHVQRLDVSHNDFAFISPSFLEKFTGVEALTLSYTNLDSDFMSRESEVFFSPLDNLKSLDLTSNSLTMLSKGTFRGNEKLESLFLGHNKFHQIPFDISFTPRLKHLDLGYNAILQLSERQRQQLDAHVLKVPEFRMVFQGNMVSCSCGAMAFLRWLQKTTVVLDNNGNYTCVTERGHLSSISAFRDIHGMWRWCYSGYFYWISLLLVAGMLIVFLMAALVLRHGNYFRAAILRLLDNKFKMKSRADYQICVFIGYAEKDYRFPCLRLLPYLESLGMTVYVRDRDSLPCQDVPSSIMDAMQSSWRIVLVVSKAFLTDDQWSEFTMRSAVYCQSPSNPARVVLLVEERNRNRLPLLLLGAVADDNIVCLGRLLMCYELRQRLQVLLKHN
ncbi:toll-like receptor 4 [Aplysia californica]|uniref:Toll-like receptor 4 n=1 Tax=Aplysia californica TaxID=6500 RepID=A0ABM1AFV1_APLCA|nr:toll-like receptor 4 [Aplysia californica]